MGKDFVAPALDVSFPMGSSNGAVLPITFNIIDDDAYEKDHSFSVDVFLATANVNAGASTNVTIVDNESMYAWCGTQDFTDGITGQYRKYLAV